MISLVLSTPGVSPLPAYAERLLPPSVVGRKLHGEPPTIDLALAYRAVNDAPLLPRIIPKADELARISGAVRA